MYKVLFNGKRYNSKSFVSYESARNFIRSKLRSSNKRPVISNSGWKIVKI